MSGPHRNADKVNTVGIVVVGICGAVLVYVSIVALQAFYVNDTVDVQTNADYGGQDTSARSLRAAQAGSINEYKPNAKPAAPKAGETAMPQSYRMPIEVAMKKVVEDAKVDPGNLIPSVGPSNKPTVVPVFGRPKPLGGATASPAPTQGETTNGSAAPTSGTRVDAANTPGITQGSRSSGAVDVAPTPLVPTGGGAGPSPVGGAGALDTPSKNPAPKAGTPPAPTQQPSAPAVAPANPANPASPKGNGK